MSTRKKTPPQPSTPPVSAAEDVLRRPAEQEHAIELEALRQNDTEAKPQGFKLSARAVLDYVLGERTVRAEIDGVEREVVIKKKFFGERLLVERSIVTVASERALLLVGEPGTGKSWLSEHLAAAICGDSTLVIQGTAGTTEDQIKYSWNIARVIAEGPTRDNMIASPTMNAMLRGAILRFEEITRCVPDVQDSLVSILSDKRIAVPELSGFAGVPARPGFNVIATANSRDQGVNELSAALKRRFNYVHVPLVSDRKTERAIVRERSAEMLARYGVPATIDEPVIELVTKVFREIREGKTDEGISIKSASTTLSTAEAIAVTFDAALHARLFGTGKVTPALIARCLVGSVVKENADDLKALREYVTIVASKRAGSDPIFREFADEAARVVG